MVDGPVGNRVSATKSFNWQYRLIWKTGSTNRLGSSLSEDGRVGLCRDSGLSTYKLTSEFESYSLLSFRSFFIDKTSYWAHK